VCRCERSLVACLQDITGTLAAADAADKANVYAEMGIDIGPVDPGIARE
jgi:hypothetical protein